jgi:hypothetical protein
MIRQIAGVYEKSFLETDASLPANSIGPKPHHNSRFAFAEPIANATAQSGGRCAKVWATI